MTMLIIGTVLFVGGHFLLSAAPVRARLVGKVGDLPFLVIYSLVSIAALGAMISGYTNADAIELWGQPAWTRWVPTVLMPPALLLLAGGYLNRNLAAIMRTGPLRAPADLPEPANSDGPPVMGMTAVTRHPVMWGIALFALAHLAPNGDTASLLLFGGLAVLALGGAAHIDAKLAARHPEGWARYAAVTSFWPGLALARGRVRIGARQVGWLPLVVAVLLYGGFLHLHGWLFGVSPFAVP